tara:strand:+ start:1296 stop:1658 length:363 start_codon:yes stop_codon:yes gene_type:complete
MQDIYSNFEINSDHQFIKYATFYRQSDIGPSIGMECDPAKHHEVRKVLSTGFSAPALKAQMTLVIKYVDQLISQVRKHGSAPEGIVVPKWFLWTTFDIIMELAFGQSLGVVEKGMCCQTT